MGLIVGNRGFFPDHLAKSGREEMLARLDRRREWTWSRSRRRRASTARWKRARRRGAAPNFQEERERIDGVIVTLPNFGEERAIADTLRLADLHVPVLIQATPDDAGEDDDRRPPRQFLRQDVGLQQSEAVRHSVLADHPAYGGAGFAEFAQDLRVVRGGLPDRARLRNLRVGAIGARPTAFNTVRYSEKFWSRNGISIETLDLSEVLGPHRADEGRRRRARRQTGRDQEVRGCTSRFPKGTDEDGEARRGDRQWMAADRSGDQRGAVLDFAWRNIFGVVPARS